MEGYCSTGHSSQQAVVPMEEDVNQQMHLIKYNLWQILNFYMFWYWGAIFRESFRSKIETDFCIQTAYRM